MGDFRREKLGVASNLVFVGKIQSLIVVRVRQQVG